MATEVKTASRVRSIVFWIILGLVAIGSVAIFATRSHSADSGPVCQAFRTAQRGNHDYTGLDGSNASFEVANAVATLKAAQQTAGGTVDVDAAIRSIDSACTADGH